MEKRKVIIDVDTGSDDAIALIMAMLSDEIDCLGICSVNGNIEVKLTTDNSLRVVECCGMQGKVPVYKGCDLPIASTLMPWTAQSQYPLPVREGTRFEKNLMHKDHLPLPEPTITEENESAVVWLINTLLNSEDGEITIVPVGPVTNIAVAMRADPRIIPKIREIAIMGGGSLVNNQTPAAEFNIWADPEALEIVLHSGCKVTLVTLDATHQAYITRQQAQAFRDIGTGPALLVAELMEDRIKGSAGADMQRLQAAPVHDALTLCSLVRPCLTKVLHVNCHTDISRGFAYGQTIIDRRELVNPEPKNCYFAVEADRDVFYNWMLETLQKDKENRGL